MMVKAHFSCVIIVVFFIFEPSYARVKSSSTGKCPFADFVESESLEADGLEATDLFRSLSETQRNIKELTDAKDKKNKPILDQLDNERQKIEGQIYLLLEPHLADIAGIIESYQKVIRFKGKRGYPNQTKQKKNTRHLKVPMTKEEVLSAIYIHLVTSILPRSKYHFNATKANLRTWLNKQFAYAVKPFERQELKRVATVSDLYFYSSGHRDINYDKMSAWVFGGRTPWGRRPANFNMRSPADLLANRILSKLPDEMQTILLRSVSAKSSIVRRPDLLAEQMGMEVREYSAKLARAKHQFLKLAASEESDRSLVRDTMKQSQEKFGNRTKLQLALLFKNNALVLADLPEDSRRFAGTFYVDGLSEERARTLSSEKVHLASEKVRRFLMRRGLIPGNSQNKVSHPFWELRYRNGASSEHLKALAKALRDRLRGAKPKEFEVIIDFYLKRKPISEIGETHFNGADEEATHRKIQGLTGKFLLKVAKPR